MKGQDKHDEFAVRYYTKIHENQRCHRNPNPQNNENILKCPSKIIVMRGKRLVPKTLHTVRSIGYLVSFYQICYAVEQIECRYAF